MKTMKRVSGTSKIMSLSITGMSPLVVAAALAAGCSPIDGRWGGNDGNGGVGQVGSLQQGLNTCASQSNMFADSTNGNPVPTKSLLTASGSKRGGWFGVNYEAGAGVRLVDADGTTGKTARLGDSLRVRRFPGGFGGFWDWNATNSGPSGSNVGDLHAMMASVAAESLAAAGGVASNATQRRLFFVLNVNGIYRLGQDRRARGFVVPNDPILTACQDDANYNIVSCRAQMATHVGGFVAKVKTDVNTYFNSAGLPTPEVVFEIGNEVPFLVGTNPPAVCPDNGHKCGVASPATYVQDVIEYTKKIRNTDGSGFGNTNYKIAIGGQNTNHSGSTIWDALRTAGVPYDYAVVHDYGWVPAMFNGTNGYGTSTAVYPNNGGSGSGSLADFLSFIRQDAAGNPNAFPARAITMTEFGTKDGDSLGTYDTHINAVLNESIQVSTYANMGVADLSSVSKWPAKAPNLAQDFRSWEPYTCSTMTCTSSAELLPVYMMYSILGPFLGAATKGTPGQWDSVNAPTVYYAQAASGGIGFRYAVFTNVSASTDFQMRVGITDGTASVNLEGLMYDSTVPTTKVAHVGGGSYLVGGACSRNVTTPGASGYVAFKLPAKSMAVLTY